MSTGLEQSVLSAKITGVSNAIENTTRNVNRIVIFEFHLKVAVTTVLDYGNFYAVTSAELTGPKEIEGPNWDDAEVRRWPPRRSLIASTSC